MRYIETDEMWLVDPAGDPEIEILIAGTPEAPSQSHLNLMNWAIPQLESIKQRAVAYLDSFIDRAKIGPGQEWYLVGIKFGQADSTFSLHFSIEGDQYGDWSVAFHESSNSIFPMHLSRHQV